MYILEVMNPAEQRIRLELIAGEECEAAARAETRVRDLRRDGMAVRVYQVGNEVIRMVAASGRAEE